MDITDKPADILIIEPTKQGRVLSWDINTDDRAHEYYLASRQGRTLADRKVGAERPQCAHPQP
jgi:hypothetical protein